MKGYAGCCGGGRDTGGGALRQSFCQWEPRILARDGKSFLVFVSCWWAPDTHDEPMAYSSQLLLAGLVFFVVWKGREKRRVVTGLWLAVGVTAGQKQCL